MIFNISEKINKILHTVEECKASTNIGDVAGASVINDLVKSNLANGIAFNTHTSEANAYIIPNDGYIYISTNGQANTRFIATITGANGGTSRVSIDCITTNSSYGRNSLFVRKGMKVWVNDNRCYANFFAFS